MKGGLKRIVSRFAAWFHAHEMTAVLYVLIILFLIAYFSPRILISIKPGERGVLWSRFTGTKVDRVYPEGLHLILPWDELTIYDVRYQISDRTYTVLSKDGAPVIVELRVRYRPSERLIARLHAQVGPNYAEAVVLPAVVSAVRTSVEAYSLEDLHEVSFSNIQREVFEQSRVQAGRRFVILDDVAFRGITLPPAVVTAISHKLEEQQAAEEMNYLVEREGQEAKRKAVEAQGIRTFNEIVAPTLTEQVLRYKGLQVTESLAKSENAKIVVMGSGGNGVPLVLNPDVPSGVRSAPPARK